MTWEGALPPFFHSKLDHFNIEIETTTLAHDTNRIEPAKAVGVYSPFYGDRMGICNGKNKVRGLFQTNVCTTCHPTPKTWISRYLY